MQHLDDLVSRGVRSTAVEAPPPIPRRTRSNSFAQERWVSDMWLKTSRRSSYQINDLALLCKC